MPRKNEIHCNYLDRTTSMDYSLNLGMNKLNPQLDYWFLLNWLIFYIFFLFLDYKKDQQQVRTKEEKKINK